MYLCMYNIFECIYKMYVCMNVCMHSILYVEMLFYRNTIEHKQPFIYVNICIYVCMYNVYMIFPQMRHCNMVPLHQLGICHNNVIVDNTFPTCFGVGQVGIQNK